MHRRLAIVVDGIDVVAEFERDLHCLQDFASVPASSPGERVPSPAATINGVALSAFGMSGSAPSAASVRINSASPLRAAIRKGVAPRVFRPVSPIFTRLVIRAFRLAPCLANLLDQFQTGHRSRAAGSRIVVAAARLAHDREDVQRRVSDTRGIRVGAGIREASPQARNAHSRRRDEARCYRAEAHLRRMPAAGLKPWLV